MLKGMCKTYSRCGKTCDERFNNVKEDRAHMLLGEKPKPYSSESTQIEKKNATEIKELMKGINSHRDRLMTAQQKAMSPVFLAQGRDDYYNSVRNHDKVPPCGYYNIENQQMKKCRSIPNFSKKHKSKSKVPREKIDVPYRTVDKMNFRAPSSHLFQLQLPRPGLETMAPDVNEKRFLSTQPIPNIFSKAKKVVSPDFSLGNGHNLPLPETMNSRIYNPNYEYVWKSTTKPLLEFDKYPARKPNMFQITDIDYHKKSFNQVDKSVPSVYFDKKTSRPSSESLPAFMVRATSRCGLGQITDKTLEHNHFYDSQFFEKSSDFSRVPKLANTQSMLSISKSIPSKANLL